MSELAARQFARVLIALQPYVDEIAFVGGWVHVLYLAEANDRGAVMTEDIDVTLPHALLTRDRPALLELARDAGFERDPISDMEEVAAWMVYRNADGLTVPIDFLTEGEPRRPGGSGEGLRVHRRGAPPSATWRNSGERDSGAACAVLRRVRAFQRVDRVGTGNARDTAGCRGTADRGRPGIRDRRRRHRSEPRAVSATVARDITVCVIRVAVVVGFSRTAALIEGFGQRIDQGLIRTERRRNPATTSSTKTAQNRSIARRFNSLPGHFQKGRSVR